MQVLSLDQASDHAGIDPVRPKQPVSDRHAPRHATPPRKGRPRKGDESGTLRAQAPWVAEGVSERTWYRRRAAEKERS